MEVEKNGVDEVRQETVYGGPTKRLFVSMLTRDIELNDAILDLLDNCIDGAMRQRKDILDTADPFKGFEASIDLSEKYFSISDNCGGIPKDYIEDAFSLGRPNIKKDGDIPTIGMYGIGMKRAIFKIGTSAVVSSVSVDGKFEVEYSAEWLSPENDDWDLPIEYSVDTKAAHGVTIYIPEVKGEVGRIFKNDDFVNLLREAISEHFGYLMQKGFVIKLNGQDVNPRTLNLFSSAHSDDPKIRAFDFVSNHDGVSIRVTIGLFRGLAKEAEIDEEAETPRSKDTAGISVICNDRVILIGDQSMKTGWGDGGVPRYHPQFRAIAGLIVFYSSDASKLPVSTTKRGLDVGSEVFLVARRAAMEGLKAFTDFTNKWKGIEEETAPFFQASERADVRTSVTLATEAGSVVRGSVGAKKYMPVLPLPSSKNQRKRISFLRDDGDIKVVSNFLFGDAHQEPRLVGGECFDRMLAEARKK